MLQTYLRETKLCEFLRDTNREELKIGKNDVTVPWLHLLCNGYTLKWHDVTLHCSF